MSNVMKPQFVYDMNHKFRGKCLIFNHKVYEKRLDLAPRTGTDVDRDNLYSRFHELDFEVRVHNDFKAHEVWSTIKKASQEDFTDDDCFVLCFLTHGDEGIVFAKDGKLNVDGMFSNFMGDACPSLAGKPKLFFMQACRGDKLDAGVYVSDGEPVAVDSACKIPSQADVLVAYSTVPGYFSWRNMERGSWFIQALCNTLKKYAGVCDLLEIMTEVNRVVAYEFQSNCPADPEKHLKKQVPFISYTLTKKLFFPPKI